MKTSDISMQVEPPQVLQEPQAPPEAPGAEAIMAENLAKVLAYLARHGRTKARRRKR